MAHITEFKIEGLAGRTKPYSKKLNRDINVFFGLNGAGKTSLLRILNSAMSCDLSVENLPFKRAEVKIYSRTYNSVFTHVYGKTPLETRPDQTIEESSLPSSGELPLAWEQFQRGVVHAIAESPSNSWQITPARQKGAARQWSHGWLPTSRLYFGNQINWRRAGEQDFSEQALDNLFQESLTNLWSRYSTNLLSEVRKAQETGLANILQAVLGPQSKIGQPKRLNATTARERVITFLKRQGGGGSLEDFETRYASDPRIVAVAEHIDKVETDIEVATAPRAKLEALIQRMFSGQKKISFTDTAIKVIADGDREIGLRSLSSGEKHALRIFAEALRVGSNTLLIDEPEISLHIDWQRELIKSIHTLSPEGQLILATHSPEIMAEIDDKYIHQL